MSILSYEVMEFATYIVSQDLAGKNPPCSMPAQKRASSEADRMLYRFSLEGILKGFQHLTTHKLCGCGAHLEWGLLLR